MFASTIIPSSEPRLRKAEVDNQFSQWGCSYLLIALMQLLVFLWPFISYLFPFTGFFLLWFPQLFCFSLLFFSYQRHLILGWCSYGVLFIPTSFLRLSLISDSLFMGTNYLQRSLRTEQDQRSQKLTPRDDQLEDI